MNKVLIILFTLYFLIEYSLKSQCILDRSGFNVIFEDDFTYSNFAELDASGKWLYEYRWPVGSKTNQGNPWEDELYYDTQFDFTGTSIILKANKLASPENYCGDVGCYNYNWHSGMLMADYNGQPCPWDWADTGFKFGLFEIRCKMPKPSVDNGYNRMWPAFWLYNGADEIDVFEYHTQDWLNGRNFKCGAIDHALGNNCGQEYIKYDGLDLADEYNTYSVVWEPATPTHPSLLTFFFNDRELFTMESTVVPDGYCPLDLIVNLAVEDGSTATSGSFEIDYIRVSQKIDYSDPHKTSENWANTPLSYDFNSLHICSANLNSVTFNSNSNRVYYKGNDNKIQYYSYAGTWEHGFVDFSQSGSTLVDGDVITAGSDRVFYRGGDFKLHTYFYSGSWSHFLVSNSHLVSGQPNSIAAVNENAVFFRGTDNKIYFASYNASIWTVEVVNSGATYLCDGDVESISVSKVFYRGTDGYIHYFTKTLGVWNHSWIESSTAPSTTKINPDPNSLVLVSNDVYFRGNSDNKIHRYKYSGGSYNHSIINNIGKNNDKKIKGNMQLGPNSAIYYLGMDNKIQYSQLVDGTWEHHYVSNYYLYDPHVYYYFDVSQVDGKVFYPDENRHIFSYYWATCENLNPSCIADGPKYVYNRQITPTQSKEPMKLQIFPNPANSVINLIWENEFENMQLSILNINGTVIYKGVYNSERIELNVSEFAKGLYIAVLSDNKNSVSELFVIN